MTPCDTWTMWHGDTVTQTLWHKMSVDYVQSFKTKQMKTITQKLSRFIFKLMLIKNLSEFVESLADKIIFSYKSDYVSVSLKPIRVQIRNDIPMINRESSLIQNDKNRDRYQYSQSLIIYKWSPINLYKLLRICKRNIFPWN